MSIKIDKTLEKEYKKEQQKKADKMMSFFVIGFFAFGLCFAPIYKTWLLGAGVGTFNVFIFFISLIFIKNKFISQLITSVVLAIFVLQFIGQSQGMAEFHFLFFVNIILLILYEDWRLVIPYTILTIIHHSVLLYLQSAGFIGTENYFINYGNSNLYVLIVHYIMMISMAILVGWWAIEFKNKSLLSFITQQQLSLQSNNIQKNVDFAIKLSSNHFDLNFKPQDEIGKHLLNTQNNFIQAIEKDKQEMFKTKGLLAISKILRDYANLKELAKRLLDDIIMRMDAQQGAVFLFNQKGEESYLYPLVHQSYSSEQKAKVKIRIGEGILGEIVKKKQVVYLQNVPVDYGVIRTGLGETAVKNILIIPLVFNDDIVGAIEINTLFEIPAYKIDFLKTVSENIVTTILALQSGEENKRLLLEAQKLTSELQTREEELMAQEEELKQNMEEMQTIQEELQRKQAQLEAENEALNNSKILRIEFSPEGYIKNANQSFYDLFEYSEQELYNQPHKTLVPEYLLDSEVYKNFWSDLRTGSKHIGEIKRITKSGREVILNAVYAPVFDKVGNITSIIKFASDITEVKNLLQTSQTQEEELRQNMEEMKTTQEELYKQQAQFEAELNALNDSEILKVEFTPQGFIKNASDTFYKKFGYTPEELAHKHHQLFVSEQYKNSEEYQHFWKNLNEGKKIVGEFERITKNGEVITINGAYAPVFGRGDEVVSVIKFAFDITTTKKLFKEAKEKNEELLTQEEELRQNMEEIQSVQESLEKQLNETNMLKRDLDARINVFDITTILSESDLRGNILYVNKKMIDISQYTEDELVGKPHNMLRHADMPKALFKLFWKTIQEGKIFRGIIKNRKKDGSHYWVDAAISPVLDENGKPVKYIGVRYLIENDLLAEKLFAEMCKNLGI